MGRWWRAHFLGAETCLAGVLAIGFLLWLLLLGGHRHVDPILAGRRGSLYGTAASIEGSILGFVLATTAIVLGLVNTERFKLLRESSRYSDLWRTFMSSIKVLAVATLAAFLALVVDRERPNSNTSALILCVATSLWAIVRVVRVIWALERVIEIATKEVGDNATQEWQ